MLSGMYEIEKLITLTNINMPKHPNPTTDPSQSKQIEPNCQVSFQICEHRSVSAARHCKILRLSVILTKLLPTADTLTSKTNDSNWTPHWCYILLSIWTNLHMDLTKKFTCLLSCTPGGYLLVPLIKPDMSLAVLGTQIHLYVDSNVSIFITLQCIFLCSKS